MLGSALGGSSQTPLALAGCAALPKRFAPTPPDPSTTRPPKLPAAARPPTHSLTPATTLNVQSAAAHARLRRGTGRPRGMGVGRQEWPRDLGIAAHHNNTRGAGTCACLAPSAGRQWRRWPRSSPLHMCCLSSQLVIAFWGHHFTLCQRPLVNNNTWFLLGTWFLLSNNTWFLLSKLQNPCVLCTCVAWGLADCMRHARVCVQVQGPMGVRARGGVQVQAASFRWCSRPRPAAAPGAPVQAWACAPLPGRTARNEYHMCCV